jgi:hypothetical protein
VRAGTARKHDSTVYALCCPRGILLIAVFANDIHTVYLTFIKKYPAGGHHDKGEMIIISVNRVRRRL